MHGSCPAVIDGIRCAVYGVPFFGYGATPRIDARGNGRHAARKQLGELGINYGRTNLKCADIKIVTFETE